MLFSKWYFDSTKFSVNLHAIIKLILLCGDDNSIFQLFFATNGTMLCRRLLLSHVQYVVNVNWLSIRKKISKNSVNISMFVTKKNLKLEISVVERVVNSENVDTRLAVLTHSNTQYSNAHSSNDRFSLKIISGGFHMSNNDLMTTFP